MTNMVYRACPKCGAEVPSDNASSECREEQGVLFVRYDPRYTKVVLINGESGLKHEVNLSSEEPAAKPAAKPASRQIGGIIGPY